MKYSIQKGDRFKCIKKFKMDDGSRAYTNGKIYVSEMDNNITDDEDNELHNMANLPDFFEHFKPLMAE